MRPDSALYVVVASAPGAVLLARLYFRRFRVSRPPIGVFNLRDVALMIAAIVLVPYLYLAVPPWLEATLLGLGMLTILQLTFEPVPPGRWTAWAVTLVLLGADVGAALAFGAPSTPFLLANNAVLTIASQPARWRSATGWAPRGQAASLSDHEPAGGRARLAEANRDVACDFRPNPPRQHGSLSHALRPAHLLTCTRTAATAQTRPPSAGIG